jgi:membrane protease YdiL (CAAX protease family)
VQTTATAYFVLVLAWTWSLWGASVLLDPRPDPSQSLVFLAGGAGPFLAAVFLTHWREPAAVQRSFWRRTFDPRPVGARWWAVTLLLHPAIVALAFAIDAALGGTPPPMDAQAGSAAGWIAFLFFIFWFGPLPEEMGWRGFALDRLQMRMPALAASVVLGSVWAIWHVPLFFVPGSFQAGIGLGTTRFWIFLFSMVPLSVLMTWVFNNAQRSTLTAVLIHYTGNLCGALFTKTDRVAGLEAALLTAAAAAVVIGWGSRDLARGRAAGGLPSPAPASASTHASGPTDASRPGDRS